MLFRSYWVLPDVDRYAPEIERAVSEALHERVSIGRITAHWRGLRAELDLEDVRLFDEASRVALELPAVHAVVAWRSVLYGSVRLHSLMLDRPDLQVRRERDGRIVVAGRTLSGASEGSDSSTWVLEQPEVLVRNARLAWTDELRGAPTLELSAVDLVVRNSGDSHKIALRATPPAALASTLDLRLDVRGVAGTDVLDWRGRAFAQLDYVDLAAWKAWIDYPLEVDSGRGALRLWAGFAERRLTEATADVALAQLATRLAPGLPVLEMEALRGRLSGREQGKRFVLAGRSLEMRLAHEESYTAGGFDLQWEGPAAVAASEPAATETLATFAPKGEFHAEELSLEPLVRLAAFLPVPQARSEEHTSELQSH